MEGPPVHISKLPLFSNDNRCAKCGACYEVRVHFDRECAEVTGGAHYYHICNCGHRWVEQCGERGSRDHRFTAHSRVTASRGSP